ncbi:hypothetical protein Tco_0035159 [Tanacetum coccineum]
MADEPLAIPLDGIQVDDKLNFIKEPVEIMDREVKCLKQSRIPIVKVRWNPVEVLKDDDVIEEYDDEEDCFEMMGRAEGDDDVVYFHNNNGGGRFGYGGGGGRFNRRGGGKEDKIADVGFFNSFEDDFDDQDLA